jgi:hypothetical protein
MLYVSRDGGKTWSTLGGQMPFKPGSIAYDETRNAIYISRMSDKERINDAIMRWDLPADVEKVANLPAKKIVWDGEGFGGGLGWTSPKDDKNFVKIQKEEFHNGKFGVEWRGEGQGYIGGGFNWKGWYPADAGDDISALKNLVFWAKTTGDKLANLSVSLVSAPDKKPTAVVNALDYCPDLQDGKWHEVVIPLADLYAGKTGFNKYKAWEIGLGTQADKAVKFSVFIDEIGFDERPVKAKPTTASAPAPAEGK